MPIAEIVGAAALLGIVVTAALAGYLIKIVLELKSELGQLRESGSAERHNAVIEVKQEIREQTDALGASHRTIVEDMRESLHVAYGEAADGLHEAVGKVKAAVVAAEHDLAAALARHEAAIIAAVQEHSEPPSEKTGDASPAPRVLADQALADDKPAADEVAIDPPQKEVAQPVASEQAPPPATAKDVAVKPTEKPDELAQQPTGRIAEWDQLPSAVQQQWHARITELTLPPVTYDARHEDMPPRELVATIKHDLVLCAKILAIANSAAQGQVKPVTSIDRAAIQLGTNMLQIIISAYHMEAIFGRYPDYSMDHFEFIQRWSCGASVFAWHISSLAGSCDRAQLSTAALIARLGSLLLGMADIAPDSNYQHIAFETERYPFEIEHWEVTTPLLSEQIARHWGIPEPLPTMLRRQEQPLVEELETGEENRNLVIICLSDVLVAAYLASGGDDPLKILDDAHYLKLKRNVEKHQLRDAVAQAWHGKALQREFMSIIDMGG